MTSAAPVLDVRDLTGRFGGVTAVDMVSMQVHVGQTVGVIGPNGAGKSTLVGLVSGAVPSAGGSIRLDGADITRLSAPLRTRLGVGRTFQIPRPFARLTVLENLLVAARHARATTRQRTASHRRCVEILERTGLTQVAHTPAGALPLLRRKRLELARALALRPRLLLLDEIGAGLIEHEMAELIALIRQLRNDVAAMVIVEHVMEVITSCCDHTIVLDFGKLVASGSTSQVLADPGVAASYLGTGPAHPQAAPAGPEPVPVASSTSAGPPEVAPLLDIRDVHVSYGGVRALRGVSLHVGRGEVVALLGANGAGKSTLARAVSALVPLSAGTIRLDGTRIDRLPPDRIAPLGLAHCLEGRRIFGRLSVEENLILAAAGAGRAEIADRLARTYAVFPGLAQQRGQPGTALSGGQQQMLSIGRALMSAPSLIIFDELSLGLAPVAVDRLYEALAAIRGTGVAMLLVEQNLERGLTLADRAYVLANGVVALTGTADEVRRHPTLRALYVGESCLDHNAIDHRRNGRTP
jgi:ABC-type branched-subunit amino acid transport system ATPase component